MGLVLRINSVQVCWATSSPLFLLSTPPIISCPLRVRLVTPHLPLLPPLPLPGGRGGALQPIESGHQVIMECTRVDYTLSCVCACVYPIYTTMCTLCMRCEIVWWNEETIFVITKDGGYFETKLKSIYSNQSASCQSIAASWRLVLEILLIPLPPTQAISLVITALPLVGLQIEFCLLFQDRLNHCFCSCL